jgi:glucose/arabinose dehydrogenase/PKD repeat protein
MGETRKMPRRMLLLVILGLLAGLMPVLLDARPAAADVPAGFEDSLVTSVAKPTAMAFTPDGRMLITTQPGKLRVYKDGALLQEPALDLSGKTCSNSERGLLGVALDPDFQANGYVYLYYTFNKHGVCPDHQPQRKDNPVNRVSRFRMSGDTVDPSSEEVLINNIPSPNGNHNAGDLHFGNDGKLYISVGDGACDYREPTQCQYSNDASRDKNVLLGKILRVNPDGTIPSDNPYAGSSNGVRCGALTTNNASGGSAAPRDTVCKETFARGFRNPFRFAMDPDASATVFNVNDVGGGRWEEVDRGQRGKDYGWNVCEGKHDNPLRAGSVDCSTRFEPPIHEYNHDTGCTSITGAAFVPNGAFRPGDDDTYLFGDYVCGKIFELERNPSGGYDATPFATDLGQGGPVAMTFGSNGGDTDLYYTTYAGGDGGQIRRIAYVTGNRAPNAVAEIVGDNYGPQDKEFQFNAQNSTDPNAGDTLTYGWDFTSDGTVDATGPTTNHTYSTSGRQIVTLTVSDSGGKQSKATVEVFPGDTAPPVPSIESPSSDKHFAVGEEITLTGSATDTDDGSVPDSKLTWEVIRHHNGTHTHPYESLTGNNVALTAPAPEDLLATDPDGNYLEIRLTATDAHGRSRTVTRDLKPNTVGVTFMTQPFGFKLSANGEVFRAPRTLLSWEGYKLSLNAPSQRDGEGRHWVFRSWSDGGGKSHTITTPASPADYTATFKRR